MRERDSDVDELAFYEGQGASYFDEEELDEEPEEKQRRGRPKIPERWLHPCHVDEYQ